MSRAEPGIVIVGGGPVGLLAAALLAAGPCAERYRIRLLEPRRPARWQPQRWDLRVYALSRASQRILASLGVWQTLAARRASPYRRMHVWHGAEPTGAASLGFDAADLGEPDLGHIVEDRLLRECLRAHVADRLGPDCVVPTGLRSLEAGDRACLSVATESGETLRADLLIAADGTASAVRSLLGLPALQLPYGQQAVVAHVRSQEPHEETAWQRFSVSGPLALLPLRDGSSSVVWSTTPRHAERLTQMTPAAFADELETAARGVLGGFELASDRARFSLQLLHAHRYCAPHVALVGDAAHTVHPLAGQGMNLGLLDAACLVEVLEDAVAGGRHPGDMKVLGRYERRRKGANLQMLVALDALHRWFGLPSAFDPLKALGLGLVDSSGPAKRCLMRHALGMAGELPARAHAVFA